VVEIDDEDCFNDFRKSVARSSFLPEKDDPFASNVFRVQIITFKPLAVQSGCSNSRVSEELHLSQVVGIRPLHVYALVQKFKTQEKVTRSDLVKIVEM